MRAVIWTDVAQFALYLTGSVAAFFLLLHKIPGGWPEVTQAAAAAGGKLRVFDFAFSLTQKLYVLVGPASAGPSSPWPATGPIRPWCSGLLAARNERDSKKALLASGVVVFVAICAVPRARRDAFRLRAARAAVRSGAIRTAFSPSSSCAICRSAWSGWCWPRFSRGYVQCQRFAELARFIERDRPWRGAATRHIRGAAAHAVAADDAGMGRRAGPAGIGSLGRRARSRSYDRIDHLRRHAGSFPAGHMESPRE